MKIKNLKYDKEYVTGPLTYVDWVAGGNFDGYIYKVSLRFIEHSSIVIRNMEILDESRYDGEKGSSEIQGTYSETGNETITCIFGEFKMRGVILGKENEYIAFSISHPKLDHNHTLCLKSNCEE